MGSLAGDGSGSPLQARASAPVLLILLMLLAIVAVLGLIFFISTQSAKYKKSEKYAQKAQNRLTKKNDITTLAKENNFSRQQANILWKICQITKFPNILFNLKTIQDVDDLFRNAYTLLKNEEYFTDESLNEFYTILYQLELMVAQRKKISSTRQITAGSTISYISDRGVQYPFKVQENSRETMTLEIPEFINDEKEKPKPLERSRFTYKTPDGLTYNFIARVIRYDTTLKEGEKKHIVIVSHSEQLESQAQRHFKREFTEELCTFCSLRFSKDKQTNKLLYIYSDKNYKGKISNISAGGCCIQTNLPVKEKQHISVSIAKYDLWKLPGIIRKTRRLPGGKFALHIQFTNVSLGTKNKIQNIIYKYDI
jgi:hypothetical protein